MSQGQKARTNAKRQKKLRQTILSGVVVHSDPEYKRQIFDPAYPHSYCRICGWLYQPLFQRRPVPLPLQVAGSPRDSVEKQRRRARACQRHEFTHTEAERSATAGGAFLPEAAHRLAPFGIYNLTSSALVPGVREAMATAPRSSEFVSN